jgi:uncharacterized RDD family membrane protein YckC
MTDPAGGTTPPPPPQSDWGQNTGPGAGAPAPAGFQTAPLAAGPAPGISYADLVTRIIAFIIDGVILGFGYVIVWSILLGALFVTGGFGGFFIGVIIGAVIYLVASAVYFVYTWTTMRASPGQKILNLETVNAADGATLSRDQAIRRWAFLFGPAALATVFGYSGGGLGILSTLISLVSLGYTIYLLYTASQDPKRQGFHDKQAGTVVVKRG